MATFFLTWNPESFQWHDFAEIVAAVQRGQRAALNGMNGWSVGVRKHGIGRGDRFFMLRQGHGSRGIVGSGTIDSEVDVYPHWTGQGTQNGVDVTFESLVDPDEEPERIIPIADLIERFRDRFHFKRVQASGQQLPDDVAEELETWWRERYGQAAAGGESPRLAEELPENHEYFEGAIRRIEINAYERNAAARRACVAHYGARCRVCAFDFEAAYGELGRDFIHVHHLSRLSEIGEEYQLDPIRDLRPMCPNCHAMIHRQEPPLKIKELRRVVAEMRGRRRQRRMRSRKTR